MKRNTLLYIIVANLAVIGALLFVYPEFMIAPGGLIDGHRELTTDCFACHTPGREVPSEKCIVCHKVEDIGVVTTKGVPVRNATLSSFHQRLRQKDCTACHGDHRGVEVFRAGIRFSHVLLETSERDRCEACHRTPKDPLHQFAGRDCGKCHATERWTPATFDHARFAVQDRCHACHRTPKDTLHRNIDGGCAKCHTTERWSPATFDHDRSFVLDRDHNAKCATCHEGSNFNRYSCYGCHEHTRAGIWAEHAEEGIRDFDNCVECHRSADEHDIRGRGEREFRGGGEREGHEGGRRRKHEDDD
jgi:hypothetical protein